MKIFLNGGGDGIQVKEAYKRLNKEIDNINLYFISL